MLSRNTMIGKIINRTPGLYFHVSFRALFWICAFILVFALVCVQSVSIQLNPGPKEYPMFIDGKKIVFLGREPVSVAEAREILARFDRKIADGNRVVTPDESEYNDARISGGTIPGAKRSGILVPEDVNE